MTDAAGTLVALRGWSLVRETPGGPVTLLHNLDLDLRRGEWVALLGANGSGKTSLLRWLAGDDSPLRVPAGLVFQDPDEALLAATAADELGLGRPDLDVPAWLAEFGLADIAAVDPRLLSAGEKQRLALAAVEAAAPAILLCDEPTALQDAAHAAWIVARVRAWRERTGGTVLWATQRRAEAALADRLLVFDGGRLVADGPPAAWLDREPVRGLLGDTAAAAGGAAAAPDGGAATAAGTATAAGEGGAGGGPGAGVVAAWEGVACRHGPRGFAGVDLALRAGDRIGLTGPSGCGKSTLLAVAAGLRAPQAGAVRLGGRTLYGRGAPDLGHGAALLAPQFPEYLFTRATVAEEIALDPALAAAGAGALLAAAGLPAALAARNPHDLSSGEKRRLAVALVARSGRPLLLLDEPTAGLDRDGRARVAALVRAAPPAAAVVVASHDGDLLAGCCRAVYELGPAGLRRR